MKRPRVIACLLCCCLMLAMSGCGNKGPLVEPDEDDERQKTRDY